MYITNNPVACGLATGDLISKSILSSRATTKRQSYHYQSFKIVSFYHGMYQLTLHFDDMCMRLLYR